MNDNETQETPDQTSESNDNPRTSRNAAEAYITKIWDSLAFE